MTSATVAIISGAAAIGGSLVTGVIASRGVKRTLDTNSANLAKQLKHDRCLAREARDQERRERAYVSIQQYVNWLAYYLAHRVKITTREILTDEPASDSSADKKMVPGPTPEENEATLALTTAVASLSGAGGI